MEILWILKDIGPPPGSFRKPQVGRVCELSAREQVVAQTSQEIIQALQAPLILIRRLENKRKPSWSTIVNHI